MRIKTSEYVGSKLDGLNRRDFKVDTYKGSGPGGQHRNKVETAVKITHLTTGINASATKSKSQARNKKDAFHRLAHKLIKYYTMEEFDIRKTELNLERIRTYNEQRGTVKNHRTGVVADYKSVLNGNIDLIGG